MFTGLIEACVPVRRVERRGSGLRLWLAAPEREFEVGSGQSVAVSGACLTVVGDAEPAGRAGGGADLVFDVSAETLARTWFHSIAAGDHVNLERALRLGERLDGHLVSGHVDGLGRIVGIDSAGDGGRTLQFEVEPRLQRYLVDKGSLTIDGISLTVVAPDGARFAVAVIPHTLESTNLKHAVVGQAVNVEADMIGKWVERLMT